MKVFVRIWVGAIIFSTLNAYLFVPTVLSFIGPIRRTDKIGGDTNRPFSRKATMKRSQIRAFMGVPESLDADDDDDDDESEA